MHAGSDLSTETQREPLVTVVLPTYNDARYLSTSLWSIHRQTYDNIETIIVDGSNSRPVRSVAEDHDWMRYYHQEPSGVAAARNLAIDESEGEIVSFLDADDLWLPTKVERQVERLSSGYDIVYSDEYRMEDDRLYLYKSIDIDDPTTHWIKYYREGRGVPSRTVAARRECFRDHKFDPKLSMREDPHLWVRLFREHTPGRISRPLACKRVRDDSLTNRNRHELYSSELYEINDLADRYPELEEHRSSRLQRAILKHASQLLEAGNYKEARSVLEECPNRSLSDSRFVALFTISNLPYGHAVSTKLLKGMYRTSLNQFSKV